MRKQLGDERYVGFHYEVTELDFTDNRARQRAFYSRITALPLVRHSEVERAIKGDGYVLSRRVPKAGEIVDRDVKPAKPGKDPRLP